MTVTHNAITDLLLSRLPRGRGETCHALARAGAMGFSAAEHTLRNGAAFISEARARRVCLALGIPWADYVAAVRAAYRGRYMPAVYCLLAGERREAWGGWRARLPLPEMDQPGRGFATRQTIPAATWSVIVADLLTYRAPAAIVPAARLVQDWRAFGASPEQLDQALAKLGVAQ